ncbi:hypothetical protein CPC08DRAFT_794174 [Agrocybe pediades]|nr:hypothetical protein CPC08DRAFT_794174 [Agrocybe pediades]
MSEHVLIVHGDLGTKERLDSVRISRAIEETPKRRFQFIVFLPGLFHFKMACADALWRIWIQPQATRTDLHGLFYHVGLMRPKETGKIGTKPGFRRVHDVLHHDLWASMLNCWKLEAKAENALWTDLEKMADSKVTWETIEKMSRRIVQKYVGTTPQVSKEQRKAPHERDEVYTNQILRNYNELLYIETSHAMNAGDIGRVEDTFLQWVYIFRATGKHKYASQTLRMMVNLRDVYSSELSQIIRQNWLCNPTGKPMGFRGVDWLVERNNLYTKVIYGGEGSARTLKHILDESILIELFRDCHVTIENDFHLTHRTIKHHPPNMTKTLHRMAHHFESGNPHTYTAGRKADYNVRDMIAVGMNDIQTKKTAPGPEDGVLDDMVEVEPEDLVED